MATKETPVSIRGKKPPSGKVDETQTLKKIGNCSSSEKSPSKCTRGGKPDNESEAVKDTEQRYAKKSLKVAINGNNDRNSGLSKCREA
jgi:hypothetical protein